MVDRSELSPGAVVTVRAKVREYLDDLDRYTLEPISGGTSVPFADILSVEPRPLKVGDRVRGGRRDGEIVAIHNGSAWVDYGGHDGLEALSSLTRLPEERAP